MAVGTIGKYERLDVLGHGTSGVVYLAWDTLLRRQVALKEIRAAGPEMERVLDEARVLDRLGRHPHIVHVNSVDTENGSVLIDMELVKGHNLADLLRERNGDPLPPREAIRIVLAVLDALTFAHERRIIHRDVKPANILIGENGAVKLTDFGLAEALGSGSVAGGGGTYPYMAPEDFAEDNDSDYRSDLWAVGVVLYEMLVGRRPFTVAARTKDPFAWRRVIQEDKPVALTNLLPQLPIALDAIMERALAKEKTARYKSAKDFSDALQVVVSELPTWIVEKNAPTTSVRETTEGKIEEAFPFVFAGDTGVIQTLDELLAGSWKHWDEARRALMTGRIERFLRAIGEVYIADLAAELAARTGASEDSRLREFLARSRAEEDEFQVADDATQPLANRVTGSLRRAPRHLLARRTRPEDESEPEDLHTIPARVRTSGLPTPVLVPPVVVINETATTVPVAASAKTVSRWWFWPLFLLCLGPLTTALAASQHGSGQARMETILFAWASTGFLSAMLLLLGIGARAPIIARAACGFPMAGGLVALGALVSAALGSVPSNNQVIEIGVMLFAPIAFLLIEAATCVRAWRLWGWLVLIIALLATLHFAGR